MQLHKGVSLLFNIILKPTAFIFLLHARLYVAYRGLGRTISAGLVKASGTLVSSVLEQAALWAVHK